MSANMIRAPSATGAASRYWVALAVIFLLLDAGLFRLFAVGSDWAPLWAAGKLAWTDPGRVYDFDLVTSLQAPLLGHVDHRPFVYPPTALLLFAPFALLPFWWSLALFSLGSMLCFAQVSRPLGTDRAQLLTAPPVMLCAIAGQPTLIVAALSAAALLRLRTAEALAGVLLGIAIAIKPTLFLLAPVALLAGGHWRALAASALAIGAIASLSILLIGFDAWTQWLSALPRFQQLIADEPTLISSAITPYSAAVRLGLQPGAAIGLGALVAVPLAAYAFARSGDVALRLVALLGGALLVTPYAMNYELALLAPAVLSLPLSSPRRLILPALWSASLCSGASLVGLATVYSWAGLRLVRETGSRRDERRVELGVHVRA
jgi:hypothetical protein